MLKSVLIKDYMATSLITFSEATTIVEAIQYLNTHKISGAPVVDKDGGLIGMLSEKDCLKVALQSSYYEDWVAGSVTDYMSTEIKTIQEMESIVDLAEMFSKTSLKRAPVLNDAGKLVGQISRSDVLRALEKLW